MRSEFHVGRKPLEEVLCSIVLPVYNEAKILKHLFNSICNVVKPYGYRYELIFINDGSQDDSGIILDDIALNDPHVRILHLSRNFGHQAAVQAGLKYASGDVIIVMDSDLQDDPTSIPRFIEKWFEGYDVVYAIRVRRKEGMGKRFLFNTFYHIFSKIAYISIPKDAGNFGLIDRRIASNIIHIQERDRYYPGLRSWVGFRQTGIEVERGARYDEKARVSIYGLWRLAQAAIFSFSYFPLSIFYVFSILSVLIFIFLCLFTLYHKFITGLAIPGWTSFIMTACFFGAINALGIGILGEYMIRIYDQVRDRPMFIVERKVNFTEDELYP